MPGAVVIVVVLLLFPTLVFLGTAVLAAVLGGLVDHDARRRYAGSELVELNR